VCPWNAGPAKRRADAASGEAEAFVSLADWLSAPGEELRDRYARLYVPDRDPRYLRRNALVAAGNVGGEPERASVARYLEHDDELLRETAAWALARLEERR
jgi:epoxyqueuosine reductase QueG